MKTEPDAFSIDTLKSKGTAPWDGVRNYLARNHMQQMAVGDRILFYHSSCDPAGVAGLATVARTAYPDHTALDPHSHYYDAKSTPEKPIWMMVDVAYAETLPRQVTLAELRAIPELADMMLFTHNRLSVVPVSPLHYATIVNAAHRPAPVIAAAGKTAKKSPAKPTQPSAPKPAAKTPAKPAAKPAAKTPAKAGAKPAPKKKSAKAPPRKA